MMHFNMPSATNHARQFSDRRHMQKPRLAFIAGEVFFAFGGLLGNWAAWAFGGLGLFLTQRPPSCEVRHCRAISWGLG